MTSLVWLVPIALGMGLVALLAFLWSMRSGQYEDLDGAAERVLIAREEDRPIADGADKHGDASCGQESQFGVEQQNKISSNPMR